MGIISHLNIIVVIMGRMHCSGKGKSRSSLPYVRSAPDWSKSASEIEKQIIIFAKKGLTSSQIGVELRDKHGVPQYRYLTGDTITRVLRLHGLNRSLPESLYFLIKKAVSIRKHLDRNRKDNDAKYRLILIESRIHRTARYFKLSKKIPPTWRYESASAATLIGV